MLLAFMKYIHNNFLSPKSLILWFVFCLFFCLLVFALGFFYNKNSSALKMAVCSFDMKL